MWFNVGSTLIDNETRWSKCWGLGRHSRVSPQQIFTTVRGDEYGCRQDYRPRFKTKTKQPVRQYLMKMKGLLEDKLCLGVKAM